ncbi:uncharacterized protein LOC135928713 [Gordionus sp. m RMFG-2023]|uniref:uncharacterized protein LOC135928713 n=1 Tax=Gordionus sp. m RMFG-2023 TaxID=3053472 RepID=UPI0031FD56A7
MAILDCTTRWSSMCMMLERLLSLKDFCNDFIIGACEIILSEDDWNQVKELTSVLVPLKITTLRVQAEQLCLSDFYGIWLRCRLELGRLTSYFSNEVLENTKIREQQYLQNSVVYASIYLDPRYQVLLSSEQKQMAIDHLEDLCYTQNSIIYNTLVVTTISNGCSDNNDNDNDIDDLEILLLDREKKIKLSSDRKEQKISIVSLIEKFSEVMRINRDANILKFWEENSSIYPELYTFSRIVMAVPATQVSVERGFSSLTNLRGNLKNDILEDILRIMETFELFRSITLGSVICLMNLWMFVGNSLVILVILIYPKLRTTRNYMILSLAFADLLISLTVVPFSSLNLILRKWLFSQAYCKVYVSLDFLLSTASILNLCLIAIEQYIEVTKPWVKLSFSKNVRIVTYLSILLVWIVSITISWGVVQIVDTLLTKNTQTDNVNSIVKRHIIVPNINSLNYTNYILNDLVPINYTKNESYDDTLEIVYNTVRSNHHFIPILKHINHNVSLKECHFDKYHTLKNGSISKMISKYFYLKNVSQFHSNKLPLRVKRCKYFLNYVNYIQSHLNFGQHKLVYTDTTTEIPQKFQPSLIYHWNKNKSSSANNNLAIEQCSYLSHISPSFALWTTVLTFVVPMSVIFFAYYHIFAIVRQRAIKARLNLSRYNKAMTFGLSKVHKNEHAIKESEMDSDSSNVFSTLSNHKPSHENTLSVINKLTNLSENKSNGFNETTIPKMINGDISKPSHKNFPISSNANNISNQFPTSSSTNKSLELTKPLVVNAISSKANKKELINLKKKSISLKKNSNKERKAIKMLGIIIGSFTICWVPYFTMYVMDPYCNHCMPISLFTFATWLGYFNSCLNPAIYATYNIQFRKAFKDILCFRGKMVVIKFGAPASSGLGLRGIFDHCRGITKNRSN